MLRNRIAVFVNLPIASLDRLSLKKRMDEIGQIGFEDPRVGAIDDERAG